MPLLLFYGKYGTLPLSCGRPKEKKGRGHPRVGRPKNLHAKASLKGVFMGLFLLVLRHKREASLVGFTVENWRKKILSNERKRRKKKSLLFSMQP